MTRLDKYRYKLKVEEFRCMVSCMFPCIGLRSRLLTSVFMEAVI
jgi:hypothetical protein